MHFFDAHTHAHFAAFENDWREVIDRALKNNVWLINVGTQKDTSAGAVETAKLYQEGVYAAIGLHPVHTEKSYHDKQELGLPQTDADDTQTNAEKIPRKSASSPRNSAPTGFTSRDEEFDHDYYKKLAEDPKVVAIGECGLDYYRIANQGAGIMDNESKQKQKKAFMQQIELASEVRKPLMIHCRNAFNDLIEILHSKFYILNSPPGVIHFFTGTPADAGKLLELGFSFTFGGVITFARDYDEAITMIPLDRILTETDAPYVAPAPYRGKRNEPVYVVEVVKKLAEIKSVSTEKIAAIIFENAKRIFNF